MYKYVMKPLLFLLSPDTAHRLTVAAGRLVQSIAPLRWLLGRWWPFSHETLKQELMGMQFQNPVGLSAGFDKSAELAPLMERVGFGFATGGSMTLEPRKGNRRPWFHRLPKTRSLVVFAGMPNKGLEHYTPQIAKKLTKLQHMPTILSVAVIANTTTATAGQGRPTEQAIINDVKKTTEYIIEHQLAAAIEINISCPNAGREPFIEPQSLKALLAALDAVPRRNVPLLIKMPHLYDRAQFERLLSVIAQHNVQGVTVANLVKERDRVAVKDPLTDEIRGGLSGIPAQQHSLELIRHTYENYGDRLVVIGVGGVFSAEDAYQKIRAGASLVGLITGVIFEGPALIGRMNRELVSLLEKDGFSHISEAIGADCKKSPKNSKNLSKKTCKKKTPAV